MKDLMHEPHCHQFTEFGRLKNTCTCRAYELYMKRPGLQDVTLRDYFAAKVMQAQANGHFSAEDIAKSSYIMADAMIAERDK